MISFNKGYYKSLYKYKKLVNLQQNVPNKKKILKFKRQKWRKFIKIFKNNLKRNRRKPLTIHNFCVSKFASMGNSFKKKFKKNLNNKKKIKMLYGGLKQKVLKKTIKQIFNKQLKNYDLTFLKIFESRLDSILYKALFCSSIRNAQQMIIRGYVKVNDKIIKKKSYLLKQGDIIKINQLYSNIIKNNINYNKKQETKLMIKKNDQIIKKIFWLCNIPPNYIHVKYTTLQIVIGNIKDFHFSNSFHFSIDTNSILRKH